jgi:excisionase family DNA binding protein
MSPTVELSLTPGWISLKDAAHRLGVHPTTLRRWADAGQLPVMLTPGGHRRFAIADIEAFAADRRRVRFSHSLEQTWAEQALIQTRQELVSHRDEPWLAVFDEADREYKRRLGRRLMGVMLQYISFGEGGDELLAEASAIGREHAQNALRYGMSLVEAMQAIMFFRDTLVEVVVHLPEKAHVRPESSLHLLRRINTLLNTVQLAVAGLYDLSRP